MYQKALSRVYSKESATHDEMMERITKAEARKLLMILLLCGDDFSSDFWPIFVTKTRFGDWSVAQIYGKPLHASHNLSLSFSFFSLFFSLSSPSSATVGKKLPLIRTIRLVLPPTITQGAVDP